MSNAGPIGVKYQPHWLWAACFLFAPFCLTAVGCLGIWPQPVISLRYAETAPRVAIFISVIGIVAALIRRERAVLAVTGLGLVIAVGGYLYLVWVS